MVSIGQQALRSQFSALELTHFSDLFSLLTIHEQETPKLEMVPVREDIATLGRETELLHKKTLQKEEEGKMSLR